MQLSLNSNAIKPYLFSNTMILFYNLIDVKLLLCDNGTIELVFWGHSIAMVSLYKVAV